MLVEMLISYRRYFTRECVRIFLKQREADIGNFRVRFIQSTLSDEKTGMVSRFLSRLYGQMVEDPIWEGKKIYPILCSLLLFLALFL